MNENILFDKKSACEVICMVNPTDTAHVTFPAIFIQNISESSTIFN